MLIFIKVVLVLLAIFFGWRGIVHFLYNIGALESEDGDPMHPKLAVVFGLLAIALIVVLIIL